TPSETFLDCGEVDGGLVAHREFVVAGGGAALACESADFVLDGVVLPVGLGDDGRRAPAAGSSSLARDPLVAGLGDRADNAAPTRGGAVGPRRVGLVGRHPARAARRPSRAGSGHPDGPSTAGNRGESPCRRREHLLGPLAVSRITAVAACRFMLAVSVWGGRQRVGT